MEFVHVHLSQPSLHASAGPGYLHGLLMVCISAKFSCSLSGEGMAAGSHGCSEAERKDKGKADRKEGLRSGKRQSPAMTITGEKK